MNYPQRSKAPTVLKIVLGILGIIGLVIAVILGTLGFLVYNMFDRYRDENKAWEESYKTSGAEAEAVLGENKFLDNEHAESGSEGRGLIFAEVNKQAHADPAEFGQSMSDLVDSDKVSSFHLTFEEGKELEVSIPTSSQASSSNNVSRETSDSSGESSLPGLTERGWQDMLSLMQNSSVQHAVIDENGQLEIFVQQGYDGEISPPVATTVEQARTFLGSLKNISTPDGLRNAVIKHSFISTNVKDNPYRVVIGISASDIDRTFSAIEDVGNHEWPGGVHRLEITSSGTSNSPSNLNITLEPNSYTNEFSESDFTERRENLIQETTPVAKKYSNQVEGPLTFNLTAQKVENSLVHPDPLIHIEK